MRFTHEAFKTNNGGDQSSTRVHIASQIGHTDVICETGSKDRGRVGTANIGEGVSPGASHEVHGFTMNPEDRIRLGDVAGAAWPGGSTEELQFVQHPLSVQLSVRAVYRDNITAKKWDLLEGGLGNLKELIFVRVGPVTKDNGMSPPEGLSWVVNGAYFACH